jgi:hypothetical protein
MTTNGAEAVGQSSNRADAVGQNRGSIPVADAVGQNRASNAEAVGQNCASADAVGQAAPPPGSRLIIRSLSLKAISHLELVWNDGE